MKTIRKNCLYCNQDFEADLREHKRGNAKYCCKDHAHKARLGTKLVEHTPNVCCSYCNKAFYKSTYKQTWSKSKLYFCCREHKDLAQKLEFGLTEIHPPHFGTGADVNIYRDKALNFYPHKCDICGYDRYPQCLVVHHKDSNRNNSNIENLQILCPTCHIELHFLNNTGHWASKKKLGADCRI